MTGGGDFYPRDRSIQPPARTPGYRTSLSRSPNFALLSIENTLSETTGPVFGHGDVAPGDNNLLTNFAEPGLSPIGERIILHGQVLDENARPVAGTLVELWQANAGGRYRHRNDSYLAPVDPNFGGCGRAVTDAEGAYLFHTVKPGAYPWQNHESNWRPAHIHLSLIGSGLAQRLVTQCYFEGDPLIPLCPILATVPDPAAADRLVARLDMTTTVPFDSIAYRFDIVLRGRQGTVFENGREGH